MGKLLSSYKQAVIKDIIDSVTEGTSNYYAFASNPEPYSNGTPTNTADDYSAIHESNWNLIFGKKLSNTDIIPIVRNIVWEANTVYTRYDDRSAVLANSDFYVVVTPSLPGEYYHVYKCIDNANSVNSTAKPDLQQATSFTKSDGYIWRYIYSISDADYVKFATSGYVPVSPNNTIQASANTYTGVEVVVVANAGSGYATYHTGDVKSVVNSTLIQIENTASGDNNFYNNNAIYIYNSIPSTSQLRTVNNYVSNISGNWVYLTQSANTDNINPGVTEYLITPRILFDTDATEVPKAYATINSTANSIDSVVILDTGTGVTWANAVVVSNTVYGSGANLYCIVPPPGGHGYDPAAELGVAGMAISFTFDGPESNTIPTNITYNKIGIYKNPYSKHANGAKSSIYTDPTFNQLMVANVFPSTTFANNEIVTGQTSGAKAMVAFSNSSQVYLVGDKYFANGETIVSADESSSATIDINSYGNIYVNDLYPLYVKNIDDATRAVDQSESFKIQIQV